MLSVPIVFVAALAMLGIIYIMPVNSTTDSSVPGSASSGLEPEPETCNGTLYNGDLCREELLNLQRCLPGNFEPINKTYVLSVDRLDVLQKTLNIEADEECRSAALPWICLWFFEGLCDRSDGSVYRPTSSYCEILRTEKCTTEWELAISVSLNLSCTHGRLSRDSSNDHCFLPTNNTATEPTPLTPATTASCVEAGFTECCNSSRPEAGECRVNGENGSCYCNILCHDFNDCCPDISKTCPERRGLSVQDTIIISFVVATFFVILVIIVAAVLVCTCVMNRQPATHIQKQEQKAIDNVNYVNDNDGGQYDHDEIELRTTQYQRMNTTAEQNRYMDSEIVRQSIDTISPLSYEEPTGPVVTHIEAEEHLDSEQYSSDASYENSLSDSDSYVQQVTNEIEGQYEVQPKYWHPASEQNELKIQLTKLKFPVISEDNVDIQEQLGSGQFGTVHHGVWHHDSEDSSVSDVHVAVKSMKVGASEQERVKFLQEAIIMGQFNNPQVLRILGIIAKDDDFKIVMELMKNGDLRSHLQTLKPGPGQPVPPELGPTLLSYSRQVACGLIYFCVKNFIHRDLAARNILVSSCGMCKIGDFGLSRDLHNEDYYTSHGGKIPVRWTAPEALAYRKYSTKSDMWSFGCVLYEIWSLGCKPFHDVPNAEVVKKLENRYRLPPPPGCPRLVYNTMIKCWHPVPESRPTAGAAVAVLSHPDFQIFDWSAKDIANNSEEARTLGAPIEEGHTLYKDLQRSYRRPEGSRKRSKKHALQKI